MKRLLTATIAALPLTLGVVAATAAPAQAASSCTKNWGDPAGKTHSVTTKRTAHQTHNGHTVTIELRVGTLDGSSIQVGWSRITNAKPGDVAYLVMTTDGHSYVGCVGRTATGSSVNSPMYQTSASSLVKFDACVIMPKSGGGYYDAGCTADW